MLFEHSGERYQSRAGFLVLVAGLAVAKVAFIAQELAIAADVSDQAAFVVAEIIAAFVGTRLAVLVGVLDDEACFFIAAITGGSLFIKMLEENFSGSDGKMLTVCKGAVLAPLDHDDRRVLGDGVGLFYGLDVSTGFVALTDRLFPSGELLGVFLLAAGVLGGDALRLDLREVSGGRIAGGELFQLGGVLGQALALVGGFFGVIVGHIAAGSGALLGVLQGALRAVNLELERSGAGVGVKRMIRREGGVVAVVIVGVRVGVVHDGEHIAGEIVIAARVDGDTGIGDAASVVDAVRALDEFVFTVQFNTVIEKLD